MIHQQSFQCKIKQMYLKIKNKKITKPLILAIKTHVFSQKSLEEIIQK
ncbi:hypothetical protein HMPREF1420_00912 [Helicobacter pylori GAM264Ai]|nr:hypothetical protein HMPREF1420_00912 [Helicobacter pylori GAM264Ai]